MSAIDTLNHVHVCNFVGLPVYWAPDGGDLNNIIDDVPRGTPVERHHIFIGGGSGEHPALLLDLHACMYAVLDAANQELDLDDSELERLLDRCEPSKNPDIPDDDYARSVERYSFNNNNWDVGSFVYVDGEIRKRLSGTQWENEPFEKIVSVAIGLMAMFEFPSIDDFCAPRYTPIFGELKTIWSDDYERAELFQPLLKLTEGITKFQSVGYYRVPDCNVGHVYGFTLQHWAMAQFLKDSGLLKTNQGEVK